MLTSLKTPARVSFGAKVKKDFKRNRRLYILFLPVLAFFVVFAYIPLTGLVLAFQDFTTGSGFFGSEWVGLLHFKTFVSDFYFWRLMRNTVVLSLLDIAFVFPTPIILALLLSSVQRKFFKRTVQTFIYMPFFISMVVICGMIREFVDTDGFVTKILSSLGLAENINLLSRPEYFRGIMVVSNIWQTIGFQSVIFVAALSGIDQSLYDAAQIDGAGRAGRLFRITLPCIMPTIVMMLTLKVGSILNVGSDKILLLYNSSIYETSDVISTYIYRLGLVNTYGNQYSYTTAVGLFNSVIGFILLIAANKVSAKLTDHSLY